MRSTLCVHGVKPAIVCPECDWKQHPPVIASASCQTTCVHDRRLDEECPGCGRYVPAVTECIHGCPMLGICSECPNGMREWEDRGTRYRCPVAPKMEPWPKRDPVNHPKHYTSHPSGVECITVARHMGFNLGNALKYIWRADLKNNAIEDLEKAAWYLADEIKKRKQE